MRYKYNYDGTAEGQETVIAEHNDKILVEIQDITEGHFLVFEDSIIEAPVDPVEQQLVTLQQGQLDIMQGMADIWNKINGGV